LPTFSFGTRGAKENRLRKLSHKKKTPRRISRSAECEEGYAPSTAQAFEKA